VRAQGMKDVTVLMQLAWREEMPPNGVDLPRRGVHPPGPLPGLPGLPPRSGLNLLHETTIPSTDPSIKAQHSQRSPPKNTLSIHHSLPRKLTREYCDGKALPDLTPTCSLDVDGRLSLRERVGGVWR
jgi:hypothetical protein